MEISAVVQLVVVMGLVITIPSAKSKHSPSRDQTLDAAIQEMQRANYYAFIMLLNMAPPDKIPNNITFLMPSNRVLVKAAIPEKDVVDFLLRHSIPTPLGFEYLKHLPTESLIPSSEPGFMLKVSNYGRKSFFLNNVKLVSPNICVTGSSVRCHGIDGVLLDINVNHQTPRPLQPPISICHPPPPPPLITVAPPPALPPLPGGGATFDLAPAATSQPNPSLPSSGSSRWVGGLIKYLSNWVIFSILWSYL